MASIFQAFDLSEALAGAKQPRRHVAGGFEAPRNSLDVGSNFDAAGASTSDIPFGYEYYNGQWKRDHGRREPKRRVPNVVARLMGLDPLPDELPRKSLQEMPTYGAPNPVLIRQHSQGAMPAAWQRPPLPRSSGERPSSSVAVPFRDHPQEEQLQRFKKEFEAKQQERLVASQLEEMNRQLEEKKDKVRATLDKARVALSQGIIADPKRQGKFEESKEFLDAMEFLQCNKDFIFQFLQQKPHVVFSNENSTATTPVAHPKPLKKVRDQAPERKREGFSPRAIARLFMSSDSRKRQPALERSNSAGHSSRTHDLEDDAQLRTSISTNSRYMLPLAPVNETKKNGAQAVIMEIKERLRRRDENSHPPDRVSIRTSGDSKEIAREIAKQAREAAASRKKPTHSTQTKSLSTGKRISMMRPPDMDDMMCTSDGENVSTPSVKIVRENVTRSCISLPSSPHLSARSHEAAAAPKTMRKRDAKPPTTTDSPRAIVTLRKIPESPRGEKHMRKSASVNENATRSNNKINSSKKVLNDHLTRSRSVPNAALLRERGRQCTTDTTKNAPKKLGGFFSGNKTKSKDAPSPVMSRVAALAEACVSHSHTLSDADSAANVRTRSSSSRKANKNSKPRLPVVEALREPPSAVVPESSADSDGAPCEDELLKVLSQSTKKQDPTPESPKPHTNQVQSAKKSTRKAARNILPRDDDDSDKSVPVKQESSMAPPPPPELKEITNDLQEPRVRLKVDGRVPEKKPHTNPSPEADFAFVRDILVASGYHTHGGRNTTRWHSPTQPIGHHVLNSSSHAHRRIFLDAVNEVLVAHAERKAKAHVATGRRLVEQVWSEIEQQQRECKGGDYLVERLVAQDLQASPREWAALHCEGESVCLALERAIWSDLLEELVVYLRR